MSRFEVEVRNLAIGVYKDVPPSLVPSGGMTDCMNVRIRGGRVRNENMGWDSFMAPVLNGPVILIDSFINRDESQKLIFGTLKDLYRYREGTEDVRFITPRYETGTVSIGTGSAAVTGSGTAWTTIPMGETNANVRVGDEIHFGAIGQTDPSAAWHVVFSVGGAGAITLTANYTGAPLVGVPYTVRRLFTGDYLDIWSSDTFLNDPSGDDWWVATNGVEVPVRWDGTTSQVELLGSLGFRCKVVKRSKNMFLYANTIESGVRHPQVIRSSNIGDPFLFDVDGAEFNGTDGVDDILELGTIGDLVVVYADRSISLAQYVGHPIYWIIRTAVPGIGLISGRAVMEFGDYHEFLGNDSQYRFDGVQVERIGMQVFRDALRKIDPSRYPQVLAHIDEENGETLWIVPQTNDPSDPAPHLAFSSHYLERVSSRTPTPICIRELPATAMGFYERANSLLFSDLPNPFSSYNFRWSDRFFEAAFPFNLFGTYDGRVYILGAADSQDGAPIVSWARFGRLAVGKHGRQAVVNRVTPFATPRPSASYELGVIVWDAKQEDGELIHKGQFLYDLTQEGRRFVSPRKMVRFAEVEFATTGVDRPWDLAGFHVELTEAGFR